MGCVQSDRPEDTRLAREENLVAEDFEHDDEEAALEELSPEAIKSASDLVIERVDCPEWGGFVHVRNLSGQQRDAFEDASIRGRGKNRKLSLQNIRARLLVLAVCDAEGHRKFTAEDAAWLGQKSAAVIDRIFEVAQRLSGLSDEDVEELVGNSNDGPSG